VAGSAADPSLVGWWKLDETSGMTAADSNHGLLVGNPEWTTGSFGSCLSLDKARMDSVEAAPLGIVSNHVTVSGWAEHDQTAAAWSGILTHRGASPGCLGLRHNGSEGPLGPELRYMWGADQYWMT